MTLPRRLVPDRVHALSRRVKQRQLRLTPTPEVRSICAYATAHALERAPSLRLLAFMQESNHEHAVVHDRGRFVESGDSPGTGPLALPSSLPGAMGRSHSLQARALNTLHGQGESLWAPGSYSNVELHDQAAIDEQLYYVWLQPVKDGLCPTPDEWPGWKVMPEDLGTRITVPRPEGAFFGGLRPARLRAQQAQPGHPADALAELHARLAAEERDALTEARRRERQREADRRRRGRRSKRQRKLDEDRERRRLRAQERRDRERRELAVEGKPPRDRSTLPAFATFEVGVPPGYEGWPIEAVRAHFRRGLDERVAQVQRERAAEGRPFLGVARALEQDPRESAGDTWPTFALNPRIACKDKETRITALLGLRAWRGEMREKRAAWARGKRDVVLPRGCYGLWRFHGALVAGGFTATTNPADPPGRDAPT